MDNSWLLFALLSALFAALVAIFGKIGLKGIDSNTATAIRAIVMAVFLVGVIAWEGKLAKVPELAANGNAMLYIVLGGIAGALSWIFYFLALKAGNVSQVAPIDRLSVVFAIILAAIFLGEGISWKAGIGVVLMAAGAILVAIA